ncbi:hypothetical protein BJV74DRAFT_799580 [Russula compacta]|nr:hypothetical protein BJV74DRAFT_799580 [Russula compacta]
MTNLPPTLPHPATAAPSDLVDNHHNVAKDPNTGKEVHVYAISGPPVFNNKTSSVSAPAPTTQHNFNIQFNYFGITWILNGFIDLSTQKFDATLSDHIPIVGTHKLTEVTGNLKDGITVYYKIEKVLGGKGRFYLKDKWIYVDLEAEVFGRQEAISFHLIPLPWVPQFFSMTYGFGC